MGDPFQPSVWARLRFWHGALFTAGMALLFLAIVGVEQLLIPGGLCFVGSGACAIASGKSEVKQRSIVSVFLTDAQYAVFSGISLILFGCMMVAVSLHAWGLWDALFDAFRKLA